ncbi:MAG TPA: DegT/DnrJ/EryC1/StrS family aminotransferase [Polyangiaceae bacterium]|jgi:dTDP-4-amino-4,6-dideoxygalactose transaminase
MVTSVPLVDLRAQEAQVRAEALAAIEQVAIEAAFVLGARVEAFEAWLAQACGARHAVGVASGTDAVELALRALGVGPGDAVVTPSLSFIAAAEAVTATGARPVFCDVDPETMNASPRTVEEAIARARKAGLGARAVVPVDLFGLSCPVTGIAAVAAGEGAVVVEDAAQAVGGRDAEGRPAGGAADAGCVSFFPTKNLGAWGDGGAVVTSRDDVASRVRSLRAHGAVRPYVHAEAGRNSRLDALQAAVLLAKTRHLPGWLHARARIASRYVAALGDLPLVLPRVPSAPAAHAWHAFVVRTPRRDALAAFLRERGVDTRVYYPVPLHRQECFRALGEPALPASEQASAEALAFPIFPTMTEDQQGHVIDATRRFFER